MFWEGILMAGPLTLSVLSGILLILTMPPHSLAPVAFIALVPLLLAVLFARTKVRAFFLSLCCGALFFVGTFSWVTYVKNFNWLHFVILLPLFVWYYGAFGLLLKFLAERLGISAALWSAPFIWVVFEYARSHFFFLALPWALLGHSQYQHPMLIQISAVTGVYGVSFLIVSVNCGIAMLAIILSRYEFGKRNKIQTPGARRASVALVVVPCCLLTASALFGRQKANTDEVNTTGYNISVVQPNISQEVKWDSEQAQWILNVLKTLTLQAEEQKPDLIVWPETSTPGALNQSSLIRNEVSSIIRSIKTPLLLGSSARSKFRAPGAERRKYLNSAYLIRDLDDFRRPQSYAKTRLLPFGEYLPYDQHVPWTSLGAPAFDGYTAGKEIKVFSLHDFQFAVTICWENIFPDLVRQFINNGAQFVVNITNEAWFGQTAAPYQFLAMSVFRAVENRIYVVRCANTGISCIIDPRGRVVDRLKDNEGQDIFVRGVLTGKVIPMNSRTFYTRYGDVFTWLCFVVCAGFLAAAVFTSLRNRE